MLENLSEGVPNLLCPNKKKYNEELTSGACARYPGFQESTGYPKEVPLTLFNPGGADLPPLRANTYTRKKSMGGKTFLFLQKAVSRELSD